MTTRQEVERLKAVESSIAHQERVASCLMVGAWAPVIVFALLAPSPWWWGIEVVAWAAGGGGTILFAVQSVRLNRAWTARARAQSALEEAESLARVRSRELPGAEASRDDTIRPPGAPC